MKEILPKTGKEAPSHIVVAFDTPGFGTEDLYPACVLQTLMGGGSSFVSCRFCIDGASLPQLIELGRARQGDVQ